MARKVMKSPKSIEELRAQILPYVPIGCDLWLDYSAVDYANPNGSMSQTTEYKATIHRWGPEGRFHRAGSEAFNASAPSPGRLLQLIVQDLIPRASARPPKALTVVPKGLPSPRRGLPLYTE